MKKAKRDYDGDGKIESSKNEYFGSRDKAIKSAMSKQNRVKMKIRWIYRKRLWSSNE